MIMPGWLGNDEPDDGAPALPVTNMLVGMKQRHPGDVLALTMARSRGAEAREARDEAAAVRDPDEIAAALVQRGYLPGQISQLSMRLGDTMAELADEEAKIEKAARRAERTRQMHERGQISAFDIGARMADTDEGDEGRVRQLQRRAESLRRQIGEASEAISPPHQREPDGVEAAASRARALLAEVTRSQAPARQAPPPFGSASRFAGRSTEHTGGDCWVCAEGRRLEAARHGEDPYPPGAVITAGLREIAR